MLYATAEANSEAVEMVLPDFESKFGIDINMETNPYDALQQKVFAELASLSTFYDPMGGAGVLIGKARGTGVIAVDVLESCLQMAKELGADEIINSNEEDPVERLPELTRGVGVDAARDGVCCLRRRVIFHDDQPERPDDKEAEAS